MKSMDSFSFEFLKDWIMTIDMTKYYNLFMTTGGIYVLWILAHFVASHLYVQLCTPLSVFGVLASPFLIASPHCQGLRWVIYEAGSKVGVMWGLIAGWILGKIKTE